MSLLLKQSFRLASSALKHTAPRAVASTANFHATPPIKFHSTNLEENTTRGSLMDDDALPTPQGSKDRPRILNGSDFCNDPFFTNMNLQHSVAPIPYSPGMQPATPSAPLASSKSRGHKKVTVVGCGQVGLAIAYSMLNQNVAGTISLVDMNGPKLEGEARDLQQGSAFHQNTRIEAGTDYAVSEDSDLVIITAGVAQKVGESRLSLVERNVKVMEQILPPVLKASPNAAICIVSNPCDIMTAVAAKIAGPSVPPGRIFGSGTNLDSSRLRSLIAQTLNMDTNSIHGYVIGEHGDSSVPVWSTVRVGGVPMLHPGQEPQAVHDVMHRQVVGSAGEVIAKKGYTNWAVGLSCAHLAKCVLNDTNSILPVSTCVRGLYGVEEDVFLSVPVTLGAEGVRRVVDLPLSGREVSLFLKSANVVWKTQEQIWDAIEPMSEAPVNTEEEETAEEPVAA